MTQLKNSRSHRIGLQPKTIESRPDKVLRCSESQRDSWPNKTKRLGAYTRRSGACRVVGILVYSSVILASTDPSVSQMLILLATVRRW